MDSHATMGLANNVNFLTRPRLSQYQNAESIQEMNTVETQQFQD